MLELRLLRDSDIPLVEKWLCKEHVKKWYEIPAQNVPLDDWIYELKERNGEFKWLNHLIVMWCDLPIGMCQYYKCEDSVDEDFGPLPGDCYAGFEKLIKEKGYKVTRHRNIHIDNIQSYMRKGVPVFITSTDYYFTRGSHVSSLPTVNSINGTHSITINYERSWGLANSHTFVGYGYTYYSIYHDVEKRVWSPVWYNPFRYVTVVEEEHYSEEFVKIADGWGGSRYFNYSLSNVYDTAVIEVYK